jgi:hypothetical protein
MSRFPVSAPPLRSPSPLQSCEGSGRSTAEIALGGANVIPHDQISASQPEEELIRRRDHAISNAAQLTLLIRAFSDQPECDKWRAMRKRLISQAVDLTRRIEGPDDDAKVWVKTAVRAKMAEGSPSRKLEKMAESALQAIMEKYVPQPQDEASTPPESNREIAEVVQEQVVPQAQTELSQPEIESKPSESVQEQVTPPLRAEIAAPPETEAKTEITWHGLVRSPERGEELAARIDELISSGIRPHAADITAVHHHQRFDIMEQIIAKGIVHPAKVMLRASADDEALMPLLAYAIKHDLGDSFLRTIVEKGADLGVIVGSGETAQTIVGLAIKREWDEEFIRRMIECGAALPERIDGVALVEHLYRRKQIKLMNIAIVFGASPNITIDGKTLLGKMILDHPKFINEYILGKVIVLIRDVPYDVLSKFDLNATGGNGQNVLHDYFESKALDDGVFLKLIELGVNPDHRNKQNKTPLGLFLDRARTLLGKNVPRQELRLLQREIEKAKARRRKK